MKRILLLVAIVRPHPGHMNWTVLRDTVQQGAGEDIQVSISTLNKLAFVADGRHTRVFDPEAGYDLADFDLVVFRNIAKLDEEAIAAAAYCRAKNVSYIDQRIPHTGNGKLSCVFVRYEHGLSAPATAYGSADVLARVAGSGFFAYPVVVKDLAGKKGRDNYLARDETTLRAVVKDNPGIRFVMQEFIPNNGDYRILVFGGKARMAILRRAAADGGHLNNTSQGGTAEEIPLKDMPAGSLELAEAAAQVEKLSVAGVDIIIDKYSGVQYILEANRAPQLTTGAFAEKKTAHYAAALRELIEGKARL